MSTHPLIIKVKQLVRSKSDYDLALFISKTLETATKEYKASTSVSTR